MFEGCQAGGLGHLLQCMNEYNAVSKKQGRKRFNSIVKTIYFFYLPIIYLWCILYVHFRQCPTIVYVMYTVEQCTMMMWKNLVEIERQFSDFHGEMCLHHRMLEYYNCCILCTVYRIISEPNNFRNTTQLKIYFTLFILCLELVCQLYNMFCKSYKLGWRHFWRISKKCK